MNDTLKPNTTSDDQPTRDDIIAALEDALSSPEVDNPHLRQILHWAQHEPTAARTLYLLSNRSGAMLQVIDAEGHLAHYDMDNIRTRCDAGLLLTDLDMTALTGAYDCATYSYASFWPWRDGELPDPVTSDPVSAVRAAYVLCCDLTHVDFDQEPDLYDEDDLDEYFDLDQLFPPRTP